MVRGPSSATWSAAASRTSSSPRASSDSSRVGTDERTAQRQLTGQQLHPGGLVEGGVVVADAGPRQQLPHHLLVDGGVLPHVQPAQVEAEHLHRLAQPEQPVVGQRPGAVAAQRGVDDVEVGAQLVGRVVGRQLDVDVRPGDDPAEDLRRRRGQPRRDPVQRPAIGLVGAERGVVAGGLGEVVELRRRGDQPVGHRQLVAQQLELAQVVAERRLGLAGGGPPQRVGRDERVAVAVAADPGAGQQHGPGKQAGVGPALVQRPAELGVERGDDVEQGQVVVPQRLVDLVGQPQPRQPEQRGLPEGEHRPPELGRPLGIVDLPHRRAVALADELADLPLDVGDRLAAHLGRVRGDDGADERPGELPRDDVGRQVGLVQQLERGGEAALLRWRALAAVEPAAPLVVDVLGQVGQQREVAEGADDVVGRPDVEPGQPLRELRTVHLGPADLEGLDAGRLDHVEDVGAGLLADHLAQDAPQQPDVVAQRGVVGAVGGVGRAGAAEVGDVDSGFGHVRSIRPPCDGLMSGREAARHVTVGQRAGRDQPCSSSRRASAASWSPAAAPRRNCSTAPSRSPRSASR